MHKGAPRQKRVWAALQQSLEVSSRELPAARAWSQDGKLHLWRLPAGWCAHPPPHPTPQPLHTCGSVQLWVCCERCRPVAHPQAPHRLNHSLAHHLELQQAQQHKTQHPKHTLGRMRNDSLGTDAGTQRPHGAPVMNEEPLWCSKQRDCVYMCVLELTLTACCHSAGGQHLQQHQTNLPARVYSQ